MSGPGRPIVVVGGGGHAKVVIEILLAAGWRVEGYTDAAGRPGDGFAGVPWLGGDGVLPAVLARGVPHAIVAVGDNAVRDRLLRKVAELGFVPGNAVHPKAVVSPTAALGQGVALMAGAILNAAVVLGDGSIVNTGATVDHDGRIGRCVHIAPGSHLAGSVTVEDGALIGVGSIVGRGRPLRIGRGAVVGSGSVVIDDVPDGTTVVGNPARPVARRDS